MSENNYVSTFPPQRIPNSKKTKKWREDCIRFAENMSVFGSSTVRKSKAHIQRNYRLFGGKLDMKDVESILNPEGTDYGIETPKLQHYPIMNAKIDLLLGEERNTIMDNRIVVTNPTSISEIEKDKIAEIKRRLQETIMDTSMSEQELQMKMQELDLTFQWEYQDIREKNANDLLNHYKKEYNFKGLYNEGYMDGLITGMEVYYCGIECGEPKIERVNLKEISFWGSNSNHIEDYPYVVRERYLSSSDIIDIWGDMMTESDYKKFDKLCFGAVEGGTAYMKSDMYHFKYGDNPNFVDYDGYFHFNDGEDYDLNDLQYDIVGGIRVLEVFWKSMTPVYAVHYFDENGEEQVKFRSSTYIADEDAGETVRKYWRNEAWHGVMIGAGRDAIFVDVGPCQVQYNRMSNPSRCHFGFVGEIYNNNDYDGMSVVDKLKPLSYKYDVVMSKLDSLIARNYGKITVMDMARVPSGWEPEKWLYFLRLGIMPVDSFKEGAMGQAKGKLAGGVANTPLVADAELGSSIINYVNLLQGIDNSMAEMLGITPQRMGSIQNRETVGGVERAVVQSSNVTQAFTARHEDLKKRVESIFLENAKIALRGKSKKFQFIMSDGSVRNVTIDGDAFFENDYGNVISSEYDMQSIQQSIDMMAQAKMQNGQLSMSTYLSLKQMTSISEKIQMLKQEESRMEQKAQQMQQMQQQLQQQEIEAKTQMEQAKIAIERENNIRDNETKILVEQIKANAQASLSDLTEADGLSDIEDKKLQQDMEKFNMQIEMEREKLNAQKQMNDENNKSKERISRMKSKQSNSNTK